MAIPVKMDDKDPEKVAGVLKRIREAGKGVIGMKLVGEGEFRNSDEKKDASIRFVLDRGLVDAVAVGCESLEELDDFAGRVKKVRRG